MAEKDAVILRLRNECERSRATIAYQQTRIKELEAELHGRRFARDACCQYATREIHVGGGTYVIP